MKEIIDYDYIYVLGIGGNALVNIANWYLWNGKRVFGYDRTKSKNTDFLEHKEVEINFEDDCRFIPKEILNNLEKSLIIYTPALGDNDPLSSNIFNFLTNNGAKVATRHDFFKALTMKYTTVAVAGTHGKTSTTALLANILHKSHIKTVSFVGGMLKQYNSGFLYNCLPTDEYNLVVEADEYDRFFLNLDYDFAIITTADSDHLDYYKSEEAFAQAFVDFFCKGKANNKKIYLHSSVDSKMQLNYSKKFVYSLSDHKIRAENLSVKESSIFFSYINEERGAKISTQLPVSGIQQVENSCAAISVALDLGVSFYEIEDAMSTYQGVDRRFLLVKNKSKKIFIDDFAHHPVEICALINSVRSLYPNKKILAVFQPHTYTRTRDYLNGFAEELSKVDMLILLPIFEARERDVYNISSKNIFDLITIKDKAIISSVNEIPIEMEKFSNFDIIITVGAGDIFVKSKDIILSYLEKFKS